VLEVEATEADAVKAKMGAPRSMVPAYNILSCFSLISAKASTSSSSTEIS
jgi:hypothetical protein